MRLLALWIVAQLIVYNVNATVWYASPTATAGAGTLGDPWHLQTAWTNGSVQSVDTIYLRGGNYIGNFVSVTRATTQSYPGEWAVVTDGVIGTLLTALTANGANYTQVKIANSEYWQAGQVIFLDNEQLQLNGRGSTITNWTLVPGWNGTATNSHSSGIRVPIVADIISHTGTNAVFRDFEITSVLSTNRNVGTNWWLGAGLNLLQPGYGNRAINLIIHDTGHPGIGFWQQGTGGELNGCMIWGTGMYDYSPSFAGGVGTPRGSAVYSQNQAGDGMAFIKNCICFRNFTTGGKVFGESGPVLDFTFASNIVFQCNPSIDGSSGSTSTSNLWFNGNITMGTPLLAYQSTSNRAEYFINNVVAVGSFRVGEHDSSVYTNNLVLLTPGAALGQAMTSYLSVKWSRGEFTNVWDYNTYYLGAGSSPYNFGYNLVNVAAINSLGGGTLRFVDGTNGWPQWSLYDTHSTYADAWPTNIQNVYTYRSDYDSLLWHVAVLNTDTNTTNYSLSLSGIGFGTGDAYVLRDAQNYTNVIASGAYSGNLNLPLTLTNVYPMPGVLTHMTNVHTNARYPGLFNAFVLTRTARGEARKITAKVRLKR